MLNTTSKSHLPRGKNDVDEEETIVKSFLTAGEVSLTACLVLVVVKIKKRGEGREGVHNYTGSQNMINNVT